MQEMRGLEKGRNIRKNKKAIEKRYENLIIPKLILTYKNEITGIKEMKSLNQYGLKLFEIKKLLQTIRNGCPK